MREEVNICLGCGHLSSNKIKLPFLGCCPDSDYVDLRAYKHGQLSMRKRAVEVASTPMLYEEFDEHGILKEQGVVDYGKIIAQAIENLEIEEG